MLLLLLLYLFFFLFTKIKIYEHSALKKGMLLIEKNEFLFLCVVDSFLFFRIKGKDGEKSIEQKKKKQPSN